MNSIKIDYIIKDNYKDLIQKDTYENVILDIINKSKIVFPQTYKHIDKQDNGESDFESILTGEIIDAKTIFPQMQCRNLSLGNLEDFYKMICEQTNDIFDAIMHGEDLTSTILYKQIIETFKKISSDENIILFIPFPFTLELEKSLTSRFASDIFSQMIFKMKKENPSFFKKHKIYFIYPNLENVIILKNICTGDIKKKKSDSISKYIYVRYK